MVFNLQSLGRAARSALRLLTAPRRSGSSGVALPDKPRRPASATSPTPVKRTGARPGARPKVPGEQIQSPSTYPGDYRMGSEPLQLRYSPSPDGRPDPGEIVWTWVPYEEDFSRGKDRPVLIIGSADGYLLALMLTSKDHDAGRASSINYVDVGAGAWDRQGRPSEVKLDRVLRLREGDVRREGAVLGKAAFQAVAAGLAERNGWPAPRR